MIRALFLLIAASLCFRTGCDVASAADLVWQTSRDTAISMAISQGKRVLLVGGREACGNCQYMKYTACESTDPPIRSLIDESYIPWFCDVDNSDEWYGYASGLGTFYLPLICIIDPEDSENYMDRTTGVEDLQAFHSRLSQHAPAQTLAVDINADSKTGLADVVLALQIVAGGTGGDPNTYADVNGDQKLGIAEAICALEIVAGTRN